MKTITVTCEKCWSTSAYPVHTEDPSRFRLEAYLEKQISIYTHIYEMARTDDGIANADQYQGKVQALRELQAHLQTGSFTWT